MPNWALEGFIATSPRPGYNSGGELRVHDHVVDHWIEEARGFGIRSVLCLLDRDQLWLYSSDLLGRYREAGFEVGHLPTFDQLTNPYTDDEYELAWELYQQLPKPVLVHCSAGMDRTGRVVRHILGKLDLDTG